MPNPVKHIAFSGVFRRPKNLSQSERIAFEAKNGSSTSVDTYDNHGSRRSEYIVTGETKQTIRKAREGILERGDVTSTSAVQALEYLTSTFKKISKSFPKSS